MSDTTPSPPAPPAVPTTVGEGRYVLHEFLGEGGSAVVYRATGPNGDVAMKLRPVPDKPIHAARFLVESVPMSKIEHPNVVRVFETGREAGYYWIAMQLYKHGTLVDLVERSGPVAPDEALALMEQVLEGLQAVHDAGFIHRDVKPQNIFLCDRVHAAVGDFGVARHLNGNLWFRTRTGQAIGTMGYRAPEQDNDAKGAGVPADIYGAAATLFFILTGRRPPLLYASEAEPRQLAELPELLRPLIGKATAYEPEQRYPSAKAFRDALRGARNELRVSQGLKPLSDDTEESGLRRFLRRLIG